MIPIVIGTVIFTYVHSFNRFAKLYKSSGNTLDWNDFIYLVSHTHTPSKLPAFHM